MKKLALMVLIGVIATLIACMTTEDDPQARIDAMHADSVRQIQQMQEENAKLEAEARRPLPPTLSVTDATEKSATLQWYPAYGAESYHLYRNGALIYSGAFTYFVDTGLSSNTRYFYTIVAENKSGSSGQSESVSVRKRLLHQSRR